MTQGRQGGEKGYTDYRLEDEYEDDLKWEVESRG
jgi:hypothetical protein